MCCHMWEPLFCSPTSTALGTDRSAEPGQSHLHIPLPCDNNREKPNAAHVRAGVHDGKRTLEDNLGGGGDLLRSGLTAGGK